MSGYPVLLEGELIRALVVGGGAVAARKAGALLAAGARVHVVAPEPSAEMRALGRQPGCTVEERPYDRTDLAGATLVFAATNHRTWNARVAQDARAAGLPVNVADAPAEGTFVTVAAHHAGDLTIAVAAGGVPVAAARIRDALAERFDGRYGDAVHVLSQLRARCFATGNREEWQRALRALVTDQFCASVESGQLAEDLTAWR